MRPPARRGGRRPWCLPTAAPTGSKARSAGLSATGRTGASVEGDISVEDDVDRLVETAVSRFGRLDVLVNNAGVFSNFLLEHMTPAEFNRIIGVNLGGTFLCIKAAAAQMRSQGDGGAIVNITSIDAVHPSGSGLCTTGRRSTRSGG